MGRVAIIGDVAGFVGQLTECLSQLGVSETVWPADLHVIQVGDLLGGAQDVACAKLVEPHLYAGRWTQLAGNWELEAVGGPMVRSRKGVGADPVALEIFTGWYGAGLVRFAALVTTTTGRDAVVTHAGVTQEWWRDNIGSELDARQAVTLINSAPTSSLHRGGEMMGEPHLSPSPVWASVSELWGSWMSGARMPWSQVHGHTTAHDPKRGWLPWVPVDLTRFAKFDAALRHTRFTPPSQSVSVVGIDPGLWERSKRGQLHALVVQT
jgi:hypothetical protein